MPILTIMCGPAGCGKSTYALGIKRDTDAIIISSDKLRGIIGKDENDQSVSGIVFGTMRSMAEYLLKDGLSVIIDATNITPKSRKDFIEIGRRLKVRIIAYHFNFPLSLIKEQNLKRERQVPEEVIDRMFSTFEPPTLQEVDDVYSITPSNRNCNF